jgi:hypothetical protein
VDLLSIDNVVSWARARLEAVDTNRRVYVEDSGGTAWQGWLHEDWTLDEWRDLKGRVADLENAYKQLAVNPAHAPLSVIAAQDPTDGKVKLFRAISLMFGETAAVYGFLRISRALSAIASNLFGLMVVEFFDDFTQIEASKLCDSAMTSMESFLKLLGWKVSMKEAKRLPFEKMFTSLGVQVEFLHRTLGLIRISNKPGRIESIKALAKEILKHGRLGFRGALSLRGKLTYAEGQLFFRASAPICRLLSIWAKVSTERKLSEELSEAIGSIGETLEMSGPRVIKENTGQRPVLVFTDGACEEESTSIGGVLFHDDDQVEAFGAEIHPDTLAQWKTKECQKQVIGQAEIYPMAVARVTWAEKLRGRKVIFFVDNDSARIASIKGYSPVLPSLRIIMENVKWDCIHDCASWYGRVPTSSNIADDPSRMDSLILKTVFGARIVEPILPMGGRSTGVLR